LRGVCLKAWEFDSPPGYFFKRLVDFILQAVLIFHFIN
jgi:hypothetical protein